METGYSTDTPFGNRTFRKARVTYNVNKNQRVTSVSTILAYDVEKNIVHMYCEWMGQSSRFRKVSETHSQYFRTELDNSLYYICMTCHDKEDYKEYVLETINGLVTGDITLLSSDHVDIESVT